MSLDLNEYSGSAFKERKIHFVNRIDKYNAGDWACSPLNYYFKFFKKYNIIRHDIDYIDWHEIESEDMVIIGGSGMFDVTESFNENINRLLRACSTVIAWSVGFNTHDNQWYQGNNFPEIDISKFKICSIRDYAHPSNIEYLPCPSVFALADWYKKADDRENIKRKFGIIQHKDLSIGLDFMTDRISNGYKLSDIANYILESEAIITNSYHCAYWATLLKRKAIVVNKFSTKFNYFKYKPEFVNITDEMAIESVKTILDNAFDNAKIYQKAFDEAVSMNDAFFKRVAKIIIENKMPEDNEYQRFYEISYFRSWNVCDKLRMASEICNLYEQQNKLHDEVYNLYDKLHDEAYCMHNNLHDEMYKMHNKLHDEMYELYDKEQRILNNTPIVNILMKFSKER